jgi:hypothetical protein
LSEEVELALKRIVNASPITFIWAEGVRLLN